MSTDHHAEGFRPSHFGALTACIHHRNKPGQSEAAGRGTEKHEEISELMEAYDAPGEVDWSQEALWARDLIDVKSKEGWRIFHIECPVDILDENGQKISHGTIDLVLERNGEYLIIDWKTGDKGNYAAQLYAYTMAWYDLHPTAVVSALIAYVDLRETEEVNTSYQAVADTVLGIWEKWQHKESEPYVINGFCDYCALRGECPAWAKAATTAFDSVNYLALNPATGLPQGGNLVPAAVLGLKNDPERLEAFITAWERAKTLVEEDWSLKEALKTHMETGFKAANHILVKASVATQVVKSINAEQFLLTVVKQLGTAKSAYAIRVDPDKAVEAWSNFTTEKFPVEIKEITMETPRSSYVRSKGKPGAGEARKKRKELE